jgi:N-acyl amino acid synthase of PEP-CTERM/exosortase system
MGLSVHQTIADSFTSYFDMIPANTPSLKETVYRLRYQVYCLETGFENREEYPDGLESDEYDDCSEHYLIRHRHTGTYAATTRLILHHPDQLFPVERYCRLDRPDLLKHVPREKLAEVSRFCVSKFFKRRPGEAGTIAGIGPQRHQYYQATDEERRTWPHMTTALMTALHKINVRYETTHWYALIEPSLFRLLRHMGIDFVAIGPISSYHGQRQPCVINIPQFLDRISVANPYLWNLFTDSGNYWQDDRNVA